MTPILFDSHSHIQFPPYDGDRTEVLKRMREARVATIAVGTNLSTSLLGITLAEAEEGIWASVGYHPEHLTSSFHDEAEGETDMYDATALEHLAASSTKVVAIGETGLDFYRIDSNRSFEASCRMQETAFQEHMHIAARLHLPVIIHCRQALGRLAEIIQAQQTTGRTVQGVVHCFTGSWIEAKPLLDLGLYLSFTGVITFPPRKTEPPEQQVQRVIERMPLNRMLIETDAPYLTPVPHRGTRNEPVYVEHIARSIAERRHLPFEEIAQQTTQNARQLFGLH